MNDYTGRLLHEAKMQDLAREASGGWRMRAAYPAGKAQGFRRTGFALRVIRAAMLAVFAAVKFISR